MSSRNRLIDALSSEDPPLQDSTRNKLLDILQAGYRGANAAAGTADYYTGGLLSSLAGLNPFVGMDNAKAASASAQQDAAQMFGRDALAGAELPMLGIFAGPMARTANRVALKRAEELAAAGAPRESIWKETGWFRGADGKWRWEIDDSASALRFGHGWKPWPFNRLGDTITHRDYFAAYPNDETMKASRLSGPEAVYTAGGYAPPSGLHARLGGRGEIVYRRGEPEKVRSTLLHEMQHSVQDAEGFAMGATASAKPGEYRKAAGEVEARAVQARMNMTPEQRRARPPWLDYDVPEDKQIVRGR